MVCSQVFVQHQESPVCFEPEGVERADCLLVSYVVPKLNARPSVAHAPGGNWCGPLAFMLGGLFCGQLGRCLKCSPVCWAWLNIQ